MLLKVSGYIKTLITDLGHSEFNEVYWPLLNGGIDCLRAWSVAIDQCIAKPDNERLNRELISAAMDFTYIWGRWLEPLEYPQLNHASSKAFHTHLLRFCKSIVKAWRIWRIDLRK